MVPQTRFHLGKPSTLLSMLCIFTSILSFPSSLHFLVFSLLPHHALLVNPSSSFSLPFIHFPLFLISFQWSCFFLSFLPYSIFLSSQILYILLRFSLFNPCCLFHQPVLVFFFIPFLIFISLDFSTSSLYLPFTHPHILISLNSTLNTLVDHPYFLLSISTSRLIHLITSSVLSPSHPPFTELPLNSLPAHPFQQITHLFRPHCPIQSPTLAHTQSTGGG